MENPNIEGNLSKRLTELILEDEVFISRLNKYSPIASEILKKLEDSVKSIVHKFLEGKDIEKVDEDEVYIILTNEIRNLKIQTLNELKRKN